MDEAPTYRSTAAYLDDRASRFVEVCKRFEPVTDKIHKDHRYEVDDPRSPSRWLLPLHASYAHLFMIVLAFFFFIIIINFIISMRTACYWST